VSDSPAQRKWRKENREHLREYHRRWREANKDKISGYARQNHQKNREKRNAYLRERKQERREYLDAYKRQQGCVDCGTSEGLMEFDHRPGEDKRFAVSRGTGYSWEVLLAEVAKCDVRCGTCHRKRHGKYG
jgi:hypothetical protein